MKKIIIMDVSIGEVFILPFDTHVYNEDEEGVNAYFEDANEEYEQNFKTSQCDWMIVKDLKLTME